MFNISRHVYLLVTKGKVQATELTTDTYAEVTLPSSEHPRTVMGSFVETENSFIEVVDAVCPKRLLSPAPVIYVHLIDSVEGGYTDVELRAFREAAYGAGAREVFMPESKTPLTKQQILEKSFDCWKHA